MLLKQGVCGGHGMLKLLQKHKRDDLKKGISYM